jgi:hypothetical protein
MDVYSSQMFIAEMYVHNMSNCTNDEAASYHSEYGLFT